MSAKVLRLTLTPQEASEALGVSRDFFDNHVKPELRVVRRGRLVLVPVRELERWVEENSAAVLSCIHEATSTNVDVPVLNERVAREGITFEQYVRSRWSLAKRTAYQYIDADEVECAIAHSDVPVLNERVARELAPLLRQGGRELVAETAEIGLANPHDHWPLTREVSTP